MAFVEFERAVSPHNHGQERPWPVAIDPYWVMSVEPCREGQTALALSAGVLVYVQGEYRDVLKKLRRGGG